MLREDIQDQHGPINHLDVQRLFQGDHLAGAELTIADHGIGTGFGDDSLDLFDLAAADVRSGVWLIPLLIKRVHDLRTSGFRQCLQLRESRLNLRHGAFGPHAHEHHLFQAELAVLHVIAIGLLIRVRVHATGQAPQARAGFQIQLAHRGRVIGVLGGVFGRAARLVFGSVFCHVYIVNSVVIRKLFSVAIIVVFCHYLQSNTLTCGKLNFRLFALR